MSGVTGSLGISPTTGSLGSPQGSSRSSSQISPLVDSSYGTSDFTGAGTGSLDTGGSSEGDQMAASGRRRPKWLQDTLREAESVGTPRATVRESRPPERFVNYVALVTGISDSEPSSYEEASRQ